jgi:hypothetical protein
MGIAGCKYNQCSMSDPALSAMPCLCIVLAWCLCQHLPGRLACNSHCRSTGAASPAAGCVIWIVASSRMSTCTLCQQVVLGLLHAGNQPWNAGMNRRTLPSICMERLHTIQHVSHHVESTGSPGRSKQVMPDPLHTQMQGKYSLACMVACITRSASSYSVALLNLV